MRKGLIYFAAAVPLLVLALVAVYHLPPVHERLAWRLDVLRSEVKYALNPPEQVVFVPEEPAQTAAAIPPSPTATSRPTATTAAPEPDATAAPSPTPTATAAPLPAKASLEGIVHEYQKWNNCGPANLSMALSYWGWEGDQRDTAAFLKPNERDKNVMPYEMAAFVEENTELKALVRVAGDLPLLKALIAAGFPVIVEKGFEGPNFDGWMGHYEVVNAYDDSRAMFTVQDSYIQSNFPVSYADLESHWRAFNNVYIVVYPPEREAEVLAILGPHADETDNYQYAAGKASQEIFSLTGRDQYFAWFNRGTNLMALQDYMGAAEAYDQAFALYPAIPEAQRPWRMLWYQTGPYYAYFFSQRYYDVINLATQVIANATEPAIEESFYWRARAFYELYNLEGKEEYRDHALEDFRASLKWHPDFGPTLYQFELLGIE